ncbi:hypothetical protein P0R31_34150 [Bradyrhizobium yuanmingense]|uniref:hypothetical protein n=1 Tax=Bradyrhizobium yuanmingense TaxID=108015 RepID=UPI0023B94039|nr:hypothetical protein [Bradyrhizobium yuanmingense]MDF0522282.1 hypothetical protein [Bradyrhizobium yuanmingense]
MIVRSTCIGSSANDAEAAERILIWVELLQWIAFEAGHNTGDQPARLADLDHGDHCRVLFKSDKASAQVVLLRHGALHRFVAATMVPLPHRAPQASKLIGHRTFIQRRLESRDALQEDQTWDYSELESCASVTLAGWLRQHGFEQSQRPIAERLVEVEGRDDGIWKADFMTFGKCDQGLLFLLKTNSLQHRSQVSA